MTAGDGYQWQGSRSGRVEGAIAESTGARVGGQLVSLDRAI